MRQDMSFQERERLKKREAIANQLRKDYPSIKLDDTYVRFEPLKSPHPNPKKNESVIDEALDILPNGLSTFIYAFLFGASIIGGVVIACMNESGHNLWWAIPAGIVTCLFLSLMTYSLFCVIFIWPIYKIFLFLKGKVKNTTLSNPKNHRLRLIWNRMEEVVGCILARKERTVLVCVIIALLLIFLYCIFPVPRYTMQAIGNGRAYQHDRWTGKTYLVAGAVRIEIKDEK